MTQYQRAVELGLSDLVLLGTLNEKAIMENLRLRLGGEQIYTYVSNVLVSVNPFKRLPLYTDQLISNYRTRNRNELSPHVFALAEDTYKSLVQEEENQCIIISGESGAGKTEASKQVMQYLAAVSGNTPEMQRVKTVMLESNPLLESFGNAKTVRNDNSSRFGKFFEIYFNRAGGPVGGNISNFLLEKSRVVYQQRGERNYHIFYQLCVGADATLRQKLSLRGPEGFKYTNMGNTLTREGVSDEREWQETIDAMKAVGITQKEQEELFSLLAGILHMGEVEFAAKDDVCSVKNADQLQLACKLLGFDAALTTAAFTYKKVEVRGDVVKSPLIIEQCRAARDTIAKGVYAKIFEWIVKKVNEAFAVPEDKKQLMIGILDIYGFEIFDRNGFEQFCINYVNEKLQQIFIELTLKVEQEEYVKEKIQWTPIKYFNNKIVCDLCESKQPPGIFPVLDDACATMAKETASTIDNKVLDKLDQFCSGNEHFHRLDRGFMVKHYAGDVRYDIGGFAEKNKDALGNDLLEVISGCTNDMVKKLFVDEREAYSAAQDGDRGSPQRKGQQSTTAGFKIKSQAALLVKTLMNCSPHYIRCIKPNDTRSPLGFVDDRVLHQVKYLGLLENVKVRRAGFAYRQYYDKFLRRFKYLCPYTFPRPFKGTDKEACRQILEYVPQLRGAQYYQLGETKMFIRYPENLFLLEELREKSFGRMAGSIQRAWRRFKGRKQYIALRQDMHQLFGANAKERRRMSVFQTYEGEYFGYHGHEGVKSVVEYFDPMEHTWNEHWAAEYGRKYYYNPYTQVTVWDTPPKVESEKMKFACKVQRITDHSTGQAAMEFFVLTDKNVWFIEEYYPPPPPPPPPVKPKPKAVVKKGKKGAPEPPPVDEPPPPPAPTGPIFVCRKKAALNLIRCVTLSLLADDYAILQFYDAPVTTAAAAPAAAAATTAEAGKKGKKTTKKAAAVVKEPPPPPPKPNEPTENLDDCIIRTEQRSELIGALRLAYQQMMKQPMDVQFNNNVGYYSRDAKTKQLVAKGILFEMDWTLDDPILYCCGPQNLLVRTPQGLGKDTMAQLEANREARRKAAQERFKQEQEQEKSRERAKEKEREDERKRQVEQRKREKQEQEDREAREQEEKERRIAERKERAARVVAEKSDKKDDTTTDVFAQMRAKLGKK